jgi:hypothetical protein
MGFLCLKRGLPVWALTLLTAGVLLLVSSAVIIGVMYAASKGSARLAFDVIMNDLHNGIAFAVHDLVSTLVYTASSIALVDPGIKTCTLPIHQGTYAPDLLIGLLTASKIESSGPLQGLGIITVDRPNNDTLINPSDKISWEVAQGFGCPEYIYAYTDASIPSDQFVGYCAWSNGSVSITNPPAYAGQDYGLTPEEQLLLRGSQPSIFLPIFDLLGKFSLTYEQAVHCTTDASKPYVVTFAQKNLEQLDRFMSSLGVGQTGVAYIVEAATGLIVTASVEGQTAVGANNSSAFARVEATKATNSLIRLSAEFLSQHARQLSQGTSAALTVYTKPYRFNEDVTHGLLIEVRPYEPATTQARLGWLIVTAVPSSDYYAWVHRNAGWGILAAVLITLVTLLCMTLIMHLLVGRPLRALSTNGASTHGHGFFVAEVNNVNEKLLQ